MIEPDPTVTCDFGWHTDADGKEVAPEKWTGIDQDHHSCDAPRGHKGHHKCQWCEATHR